MKRILLFTLLLFAVIALTAHVTPTPVVHAAGFGALVQIQPFEQSAAVSATQMPIHIAVAVFDGVNPPRILYGKFTLDISQTAATNLATLKTAAVQIGADNGFTYATTDVRALVAIN